MTVSNYPSSFQIDLNYADSLSDDSATSAIYSSQEIVTSATSGGVYSDSDSYVTYNQSDDSLGSFMFSGYDGLIDGLLILVFTVATLSNTVLLIVFYRRPGLRNLSNKFVINLLATNLISCLIIIPSVLYDSILYDGANYSRDIARFISSLIEGLTTGLFSSSVLSVILIGVDQYFAVIEPLRYHTIIQKHTAHRLIYTSWICSFFCGILGTCNSVLNDSLFNNPYTAVYPILFSLIIFLLPFIVLCYIYICIYMAAHENSLRTRTNCSSSIFNNSNNELRVSNDSILKDKPNEDRRKHHGKYLHTNNKCSHEVMSKHYGKRLRQDYVQHYEGKPLLNKECKRNVCKVSKRNELYPITSIEDIDNILTEKKSENENTNVEDKMSNGHIVMKIDAKQIENNSDDPNKTIQNKNEFLEIVKNDLKQIETKNSSSEIYKSNNNFKLSSLNRQLISNTIVTSLNKCLTNPVVMNSDIENSFSSIPSMISSSQNTVDTQSIPNNNESIVSLSSYSTTSSMSDITLFNYYQERPLVSHSIYDDFSTYLYDKELISSLYIHRENYNEEPITSLQGKDRYVRISLGHYNGIENVHVCNNNNNIINKNNICDKPSCKGTNNNIGFRLSHYLDSSQSNLDEKVHKVCESQLNKENILVSEENGTDCDTERIKEKEKKENETDNEQDETKIMISNEIECQIDCETEKETKMMISTENDAAIVEQRSEIINESTKNEKYQPKTRIYKKHSNCTEDRRKQFYENERRKSNDSKCSSDDIDSIHHTNNSQYYRNMQLFSNCPRDKNIDLIISKSNASSSIRPSHHSSTRSSLKSTSGSLVNSLKHRISNASMFKYREETRAAKISISVIIMALLCWLPFTILLLLHSPLFSLINYSSNSSFTFEKFTILCLTLHFVISPVLFAHRNKKIKKELKIMWTSLIGLCCCCRKTSREQSKLRNSFYNDYYINKERLIALKEKQRIEASQMENATQTSEEIIKNENKNDEIVVVQLTQEDINNNNNEKNFSFLNKLLDMKLKYWNMNEKSMKNQNSLNKNQQKKNSNQLMNVQRSSISSNTVSANTTDVCCEL